MHDDAMDALRYAYDLLPRQPWWKRLWSWLKRKWWAVKWWWFKRKAQTVTFDTREVQKGDTFHHPGSNATFRVTSVKVIPAVYEEIPILDDDGIAIPYIEPYRHMIEGPKTEVKIKRINNE